MPIPLSWRVDPHDGLVLVTVRGTVDPLSGRALCHALVQWLLREPAAVLVELSGATVAGPEAAATFWRLAQQSDLWPGTPIGLCGLDGPAAGMIVKGSGQSLPMFDTVADARTALTRHSAQISELIVPERGAARCARDIATEACARWNLPRLTAPAALVASELVTNAVVHTHTLMTLQLKRRPRHLYLAVFDGSHTEPVPRRDHNVYAAGGRGLQMVEFASTRWGYQRHPDGKIVWAAFATSAASRPIARESVDAR